VEGVEMKVWEVGGVGRPANSTHTPNCTVSLNDH